ncbi:MAG TPA: hypothetical protein VGM58_05775 [Verrucomicrobiae bacterium]|jgi:hypothetical protein
MKIFSILIFAALVALTGCKRETMLSGQMFSVTQGADNVKLGDVEILLIEKSQVADFLQKKQLVIEAETKSRFQEYANAVQKYKEAQTRFNWFTTSKPYETNADWIKMKSRSDSLYEQYVQQTNHADQLQAYIDKVNDAWAVSHYEDDSLSAARNNALNAQTTVLEKSVETMETWASLRKELFDIETTANVEASNKLEIAESDVMKVNKTIENYPTSEDYFQNFSPVVFQKTISDSDGKFSFSYPPNKSFTIFARAQRMILNKTETYYWLINAPTGSKAVQILLS